LENALVELCDGEPFITAPQATLAARVIEALTLAEKAGLVASVPIAASSCRQWREAPEPQRPPGPIAAWSLSPSH
jgi:hypothetical protein